MTKQAEGAAAEGPARGRGRRPTDEVRADVFGVVGEVLLKEGIADLTFERVARLVALVSNLIGGAGEGVAGMASWTLPGRSQVPG